VILTTTVPDLNMSKKPLC